jgi:hypothetical protein
MWALCEKEFTMSSSVKKSRIIISIFFIVSVIAFIITTLNLIYLSPFNNWFYLSSSLFFAWLYLNPEIGKSKIGSMPTISATKAWYLVPVSGAISVLGAIFT